MNKLLLISLVSLILLISGVSALGVTPGRTTMEFAPGKTQGVSFNIVNSEHKAANYVVSVQGDLKNYVTLSESAFSMKADESGKDLSYTVNLPNILTPGLHTAEIVVVELPGSSPTSEASVMAALAVITQLHVSVPYPGKYAEADLNVINADANGEVTFIIPIVSKGDLDIASASANIDIYNSAGEKVDSFATDETELKSKERRELVSKWKAKVPVGTYRAKAVVIYDGETINLEKQFEVGNAVLELSSVKVNNFNLGDIAKFELLVENKWSEKISGAYARVQVFNHNGAVMADFKSAVDNLQPFEKKVMTAYWDTKGVKTGTYDASVFLNYADKTSQKGLQLKISENSIEVIGLGFVLSSKGGTKSSGNTLLIILVVAVVVLIIINVSWFLFLRKRFTRGQKLPRRGLD